MNRSFERKNGCFDRHIRRLSCPLVKFNSEFQFASEEGRRVGQTERRFIDQNGSRLRLNKRQRGQAEKKNQQEREGPLPLTPFSHAPA